MSFDGVTIFTDEWINNSIVEQVESKYKIGWLHEPYCLHPETYEKAIRNEYKFDLILTYYEPLLSTVTLPSSVSGQGIDYLPSKYRFCPYGGTWIDKSDWGIKPKSKLCSMLIGSKMATEGHKIRHDIAEMIKEGGYNVDFYGVKGKPVGYGQDVKKLVLADYQFSIVTETCWEDNLFTEWLLDCLALGTIPIFWGAPNIYKFFEIKGILQFDTISRLEKILAGLSTRLYSERLPYVVDNLNAVEEYYITEDWLYLNVLREFE